MQAGTDNENAQQDTSVPMVTAQIEAASGPDRGQDQRAHDEDGIHGEAATQVARGCNEGGRSHGVGCHDGGDNPRAEGGGKSTNDSGCGVNDDGEEQEVLI